MPTIRVSAVVLRDEQGRVLTVRKRGTQRFMLVGGKHEPGEPPTRTAVREAREELGLDLDESMLSPVGVFTSAAANEPGHQLVSHVYAHPWLARFGRPEEVSVAAEIAEHRWLDAAAAPPDDLAPMLQFNVLPALLSAVDDDLVTDPHLAEQPRDAVVVTHVDTAM